MPVQSTCDKLSGFTNGRQCHVVINSALTSVIYIKNKSNLTSGSLKHISVYLYLPIVSASLGAYLWQPSVEKGSTHGHFTSSSQGHAKQQPCKHAYLWACPCLFNPIAMCYVFWENPTINGERSKIRIWIKVTVLRVNTPHCVRNYELYLKYFLYQMFFYNSHKKR